MEENKKFRLTDNRMMFEGAEVFQIEALVDFGTIKLGDLGGFVEREENLSTDPNDISWVNESAVVYGDSTIKGESLVSGGSVVSSSHVSGKSHIKDSRLRQSSNVSDSIVVESTLYLT